MAVVGSNLTSGSDTDSGTTATTASVSPTSNNLILLGIVNTDSGAAPTISGLGLTWVQIDSSTFNVTSQDRRINLFRALGTVTPGTVTITFGSGTQDIRWSMGQFSGIDTGGTNGSGAIVQSAKNVSETAATSWTVTLGAFSNVDNGAYGCFGASGSDGATVGSGFTLLSTAGGDPDNTNLTSEWRADNDTSVDYSQTNSHRMGGIAVEIKAAVAGGSAPSGFTQMLMGV